jgi:hypothetical protein
MQSVNYRYCLREDMVPIEGSPAFNNANVLWLKDAVGHLQKNAEHIQGLNDLIGVR